VRRAAEGIQALNEKYKSDRPCIFYLFHRPRLWNEKNNSGWATNASAASSPI
jgi:hypothetical protein